MVKNSRYSPLLAQKIVILFLFTFTILAFSLLFFQLSQQKGGSIYQLFQFNNDNIPMLLIQNYTLPRIAMALLAGLGLGWASSLLQQLIRNPLAADGTLAVSSGAQFALMLTAVFIPSLLIYGRTLIGFIGAVVALSLVFLLAWRKTLSPLLMILSGLVVNLYFAALSAALLLFYPEESRGLMSWGAGSLVQESWLDTLHLALLLLPALLLQGILMRAFTLLSLDDTNAQSLGVPLFSIRLVGILLSAYLVAIVVSRVGMLGFIGLVATAITRQCSIYSFKQQLLYSSAFSALLLAITDLCVQWYAEWTRYHIPTGAVTALFGTPLLLWLMFKLLPNDTRLANEENRSAQTAPPRYFWGVLILLCFVALSLSLGLGQVNVFDAVQQTYFTRWHWSMDDTLLALRLPRTLIALSAGVLLAIAGVFLQRLSYNPMASPELLGITSGVGLGVLIAIFVFSASTLSFWLSGILGALLMLNVIMLINQRNGMLPEKVLLTGISLTALFDAITRILLASGDLRIFQLLSWSAGSTYQANLPLALLMCTFTVLFLFISLPLSRWLDL